MSLWQSHLRVDQNTLEELYFSLDRACRITSFDPAQPCHIPLALPIHMLHTCPPYVSYFQDQNTWPELVGVAHEQTQHKRKELGWPHRSGSPRYQVEEPSPLLPQLTSGSDCSRENQQRAQTIVTLSGSSLQLHEEGHVSRRQMQVSSEVGVHWGHQVFLKLSRWFQCESGWRTIALDTTFLSLDVIWSLLTPINNSHLPLILYVWHP